MESKDACKMNICFLRANVIDKISKTARKIQTCTIWHELCNTHVAILFNYVSTEFRFKTFIQCSHNYEF